MCGIAGVLDLRSRPVSPVAIRAMTEAVAHRGPDGSGQWVDGPVGLGHRRLAIIDLSDSASQPMATADGRYVLVFNGEIYNFHQLRAELKSLGYRFVSKSDSEVLLYAFAAWGSKCVQRLNGMFAFAVWDTSERTLTLARDRYGIKPLYYARHGAQVLFASEVRALLGYPGFRWVVDTEALQEYFTFQNIFTDRTLYSGVSILPAGHTLSFSIGRTVPCFERFWDFEFREPSHPDSPEEYRAETNRLFTQAVNRMLVADVDVGAYLSGGLDSGSISAVAARSLPFIRTFTVGFDLTSASGLELALDERPAAERLSYLLKTEHYEMVLKAGDMERCHPDLVRHIEEPRVGQSYPNWYAAMLASRFVKVVLAGIGGDELFGGYPWRYRVAMGRGGLTEMSKRYFQFWNRLVPEECLGALFAPLRKGQGLVDTRGILAGILSRNEFDETPSGMANCALYFEAKTFLHGLLVVEDKLSMAHGLETRLPFLDNDLVDFAQVVPIHLKVRGLRNDVIVNENDPLRSQKHVIKSNDGKLILRKALDLVPRETLQAPKQGFTAPDQNWFRGESIRFVKSRILNAASPIYSYLDRRTTFRLINDHLTGRTNRRLFIWSVLVFDEWLRQHAVGRE